MPLVKVGKNHDITLPKEVIDNLNISVGDYLEMHTAIREQITKSHYIRENSEDTSDNDKNRISLTHCPADMKNRRERYKEAADLLLQWMDEEDDYDEQVWPEIRKELTKTSIN